MRQFGLNMAMGAAMLAALGFSNAARAQDAALIEAAKKEGQVVWYTGLIVNLVVRPLSEGFEKKYGIKPRIVDLRNCLQISTGTEGASTLEVAEGSSGTFTIDSSNCGGISIDVWLCKNDASCKGGTTEGGLTIEPATFTLTPDSSSQTVTVSNPQLPGAYGVGVDNYEGV